MSDVVSHPVRSQDSRSAITNLGRIRHAAYAVTTQRGSVYRIRLNPTPPMEHKGDSSKASLLVSMNGAEEVPQYAHIAITVGDQWEIHPGHRTSPIKSIEVAPVPN